jgi:hypothetical protein
LNGVISKSELLANEFNRLEASPYRRSRRRRSGRRNKSVPYGVRCSTDRIRIRTVIQSVRTVDSRAQTLASLVSKAPEGFRGV